MAMSLNLGGDGAGAFPFDKIGDSITGQIADLEEVQQTNMDDNTPAVWADGKPKMMYRVTLKTALRSGEDPNDDGTRSVYLRGSKKADSKSSLAAVLGAVKAATGGTDLKVGGTLSLTYASDGIASQRGWNPPKQYTATYAAPSVNLDGQAAPAAAAAAAQATPATAAPEQNEALLAALANLNPDALAALTGQKAG